MDDAVASKDIGGDDVGVVDHDAAVSGGNLDRRTVESFDGSGCQGGAVDVAAHDVVGEDLGELGDVGEEGLDGALGKRIEGGVGRGCS